MKITNVVPQNLPHVSHIGASSYIHLFLENYTWKTLKMHSLQSCLFPLSPALTVIYPWDFKCPTSENYISFPKDFKIELSCYIQKSYRFQRCPYVPLKMQTLPSLFIRKVVAFSLPTPQSEPLERTLMTPKGVGVRMNLTIFLPVGYTVLCNLSSLTKLVSWGKTIKH